MEINVPYSTLKYLQQKGRNQVPEELSVTGASEIQFIHQNPAGRWFDIASLLPLEFLFTTPGTGASVEM